MIGASKSSSVPHRILLVDDNQHGNIARKTWLEEHGYIVSTALSGEAALELFESDKFDVVVTDLRMSGMSGVELIARIRASAHPVYTILLSGFAACLGLDEGNTGADAVLAKSNKEEQHLLRAVRQLLDRRKPASSQKRLRTNMARSG